MKWDKEDKEALLAFKSITDCDDTRFKEKIKEILLNNRYIVHVLNNKELEDADAEPDDYYNVNILPYYLIAPVQTSTMNYVCYEISYNDEVNYRNVNKPIRLVQITFYVLCHHQDIIEKDTGLARHDLLAALLLDQFNWTNIFGMQIHCMSDRPSTTDTNFATRTLTFVGEFPRSNTKTKDGETRVVNSDVVTK